MWGGSLIYEAAFFSLFPGTTVSHTLRLFFFPFFSSFSFESITLWNYSFLPLPSCRQHSRPPSSSFRNSIPDIAVCSFFFSSQQFQPPKTRLFPPKKLHEKPIYIYFSLFVSLRHLEGNGNENTEKGDFSSSSSSSSSNPGTNVTEEDRVRAPISNHKEKTKIETPLFVCVQVHFLYFFSIRPPQQH